MVVTPIDHGLDYIGKSTGHRSKGLHMSDLYNSLFKELEPKRFNSGTPMNPMHLEMGLAWENMLEDGLRDRLQLVAGESAMRPGEFVTEEGIIFSPDLLIYEESGRVRLGEIKLTWMSCRDMPDTPDAGLPPKLSKWTTQMQAYCRNLDTTFARLYAFFVNGEYAWMKKGARGTTQPGGPRLLAYDITYTQQELDDNWTMLIEHAKHAGMIGVDGRALPEGSWIR